MLIVTTPILEGKKIIEYKGPLFAQVANGTGFGRSMGALGKAFSGGRSHDHEELIVSTRELAFEEMIEEAKTLGANAIIGLSIDYEMLTGDTLLMFKASGTAVVVE